jgi:hypothetical protein
VIPEVQMTTAGKILQQRAGGRTSWGPQCDGPPWTARTARAA